jgi:uncharacterized protein YbaR (Trm112 family)
MKESMIDILVCPDCGNRLNIQIHKKDADNIIEGRLLCGHCDTSFNITNSIPELLPKTEKQQ